MKTRRRAATRIMEWRLLRREEASASAIATASPPSMSNSTSRSISTTTLPTLWMMRGGHASAAFRVLTPSMNGKTQYGSSPLPNLATRGRGLADAGNLLTRPRSGSMPDRGPALQQHYHHHHHPDRHAVRDWRGDSVIGWQKGKAS